MMTMLQIILPLVVILATLDVVFGSEKAVRLPTTLLESGVEFPMIGLEIDGLRGDAINDRIMDAMQNTTQFTLFQTAQRNKNERRLNAGIVNTVKASDLYSSQIHVITKIPYTHLGYERTRLSVKQSLESINNRNTQVHILLEWPRCDDNIAWMNCEDDERRLPQSVKTAGPPPHHNPEFAFLDSWRALEEIYLQEVSLGSRLPNVASIGVANFEVEDLQTLEMHSRVLPHIVQKNVWSYIMDPFLIDFCSLNAIHFNAIDVITEVFGKDNSPPRALGSLHMVAQELRAQQSQQQRDSGNLSPQQILLKWFVQQGVSVSAMAWGTDDVREYSPYSIASIPDMSRQQQEYVEAAVTAMLQGQDLPPPMARFHNRFQEVLNLFWFNEETGEERFVDQVAPGKTYVSSTYTGHKFVVYAADDDARSSRKEMLVQRSFGESQRFLIKDLEPNSMRNEL